MKDQREINIDILKHLENLSDAVNKIMAARTKTVLKRYPITFGILILIGGMALHEGLKGLMRAAGLLEINPAYLALFGLLILIITGTLYKKLNK